MPFFDVFRNLNGRSTWEFRVEADSAAQAIKKVHELFPSWQLSAEEAEVPVGWQPPESVEPPEWLVYETFDDDRPPSLLGCVSAWTSGEALGEAAARFNRDLAHLGVEKIEVDPG